MKISKDDVVYTAKLAKLRFSDEEAVRLAGELERILSHIGAMDSIDIKNVEAISGAGEQKSVVRPDENVVFGNSEGLFKNTKSMRGTYIQVPKIIE